jgi:hypothetical protein
VASTWHRFGGKFNRFRPKNEPNKKVYGLKNQYSFSYLKLEWNDRILESKVRKKKQQ